MKEDIHKSQQAGANAFLTKPIDRIAFYGVLEKYLSPATKVESPPPAASAINELDDISDLIATYANQLPETYFRIEQHIKAKEWEGVQSEIHQLKGTGGAFGFPEITEQCIDIEKFLQAKNYVSAKELIERLNDTFTRICSNLA